MPKDWTVRQVETAEPGVHRVSPNLYLNVVPESGRRSWLLRYKGRDGRDHWVGLGSFPVVTLAEARDMVIDMRRQLAKGIDPLEQKRQEGRARAKPKDNPHNGEDLSTIEKVGEAWIKAMRLGWKHGGGEHERRYRSHLNKHVYPKIGHMDPRDVDTPDVRRVLDPIWGTLACASLIRNVIERLLSFAKHKDGHPERWRPNPARWKDHLEHEYPQPGKIHKVTPMPSLPYVKMPGFVAALHGQYAKEMQRQKWRTRTRGVAVLVLELAALTGVRHDEARCVLRSEIDDTNRLWNIPAARMKGGEDHSVPLSDRALAIIAEMDERFGRQRQYAFPGRSAERPIDDSSVRRVLNLLGVRGEVTVHGFRTTLDTWASDHIKYPDKVIEASLAHKIGNMTTRAYRRTTFLDQRRQLMDDWAAYCMSKVEEPSLPRVEPETEAA